MISFGAAICFLSVICDETNLWGLNFASFSIGVCIAIYDRKLQSYLGTVSVKKATLLSMMTWLFFLTYVILHNLGGYMLRNALKGSIAAFFILMICGIVAMKPDGGFAGLEKIGAIPYELYLCHGVLFFVVPSLLNNNAVLIVPVLLISMFGAWIIGTQPVVHVMVETPDHDTCQKYVDEVVNVICEKGYKGRIVK